MRPIEFSARERHFLDHLAPVWHAIPAQFRGRFYVGPGVVDHARSRGIEAVEGWPRRDNSAGPIVCSSWGDLKVCQRVSRPMVLMEHGAGQTYGNRHTSYAGGKGRDRVALLICPNDHAAQKNLKRYPHVPTVVIGSPHVDELRELGGPAPGARPTAAISFHWRCEVRPETYTALDHYAPHLETVAAELERAGVTLLGHAHPRIVDEAGAIYRGAGIELVEDFAEVVRRAHLYAVDNSSTLFEFAALDRPVVVLNAPHFRREIEYGLRFWRDAKVGANVDGPRDLSRTILTALEDAPPLPRLRAQALGRVYPVRDGSSALLAAQAIVRLVNPRACIVCGAGSCSCGGPTNVVAVDQRTRSKDPKMGTLKRYPNPAKPGAYLKLSDRDAERLGVLGRDVGAPSRRAPAPDITNEGGTSPITSSTAAAPSAPAEEEEDPTPKGALKKGGPTARARAAEAKAKAAAEAEEDDDQEDDDVPDDKKSDPPEDKKRPAPSSTNRRRRRTSSSSSSSSTKKDA